MKDKEENKRLLDKHKRGDKLKNLQVVFFSIMIILTICVLIVPIIGTNPLILLFIIGVIIIYNYSNYLINRNNFKIKLARVTNKILLYIKKKPKEADKKL